MPYVTQGPYVTGGLWRRFRDFSASYPGVYVRGNGRWFVYQVDTGEVDGALRVWGSPDAGLTWASMDQASMPSVSQSAVGSAWLDADTLRICYGGSPPETAGLGIPAVRDFDLVTNTLGPLLFNLDFLLPAPLSYAGYQRSTVAAEDRIFIRQSTPLGGHAIKLIRHDGLGFLPEILVSDNVMDPDTKICAAESIYMDSAGTSHIIYSERIPAGFPRIVYYRQIDAAGVMTAPVTVYTYNFNSRQTFGFADRVGNTLVFPFPFENGTSVLDQYWTGAMLVIDPCTSPTPVVSVVAVPTQRLNLESTALSGSIHASTFGGQVFLWWVEELSLDGLTPLSRIMYAPWSGGPVPAGTVWHDDLASPSFGVGGPMTYLNQPIMDAVDPMLLVGMVGGYTYWFSIAGPPGAPAVMANQGSRRMHVLVPNHFDQCLASDLCLHQVLDPRKVCCEPVLWHNINWIRAPKNFIPFRKVAAIPTPLAITGDVEVVGFDVPTGYDGIIAGVFNVYTGPGFQEGNGDLQWRIRINRVYAVQLGLVQVTLGSRAQPFAIDGGIQIQSGQHISYIVSAPNLSGGILPLASQIVCGLEGLFYARQ